MAAAAATGGTVGCAAKRVARADLSSGDEGEVAGTGWQSSWPSAGSAGVTARSKSLSSKQRKHRAATAVAAVGEARTAGTRMPADVAVASGELAACAGLAADVGATAATECDGIGPVMHHAEAPCVWRPLSRASPARPCQGALAGGAHAHTHTHTHTQGWQLVDAVWW